jgi:hypothetical protein
MRRHHKAFDRAHWQLDFALGSWRSGGGFIYWSGTQWQARLAGSDQAHRVGPGVRMQVVEAKNLALTLRPTD